MGAEERLVEVLASQVLVFRDTRRLGAQRPWVYTGLPDPGAPMLHSFLEAGVTPVHAQGLGAGLGACCHVPGYTSSPRGTAPGKESRDFCSRLVLRAGSCVAWLRVLPFVWPPKRTRRLDGLQLQTPGRQKSPGHDKWHILPVN